MKTVACSLLIITLLPWSFSCNQPKDKTAINTEQDTLKARLEKENKRLEARRQIVDGERAIDSIRLDKVLADAIEIAGEYKGKAKFKKDYEVVVEDTAFLVRVNLTCDFHFTSAYPHLIIRRESPGTLFFDIFLKSGDHFEKVATHEMPSLIHTGDTIQDVNGDGLKDFVVKSYSSAGCCLRDVSNVYLLRPDKKTFSVDFEFMNPTFSPKEKVIRGVCYGHPGETEMYKYKWKGERVDTLEYVSFERTQSGERTGKIILSDKLPSDNNYKVLRQLNEVPEEYKEIEGYDWFNGL